jgi:hypothetical protein
MKPLQKAIGSLVSSLKIGVSSFKSIGAIGLMCKISASSILAQTRDEGSKTLDRDLPTCGDLLVQRCFQLKYTLSPIPYSLSPILYPLTCTGGFIKT